MSRYYLAFVGIGRHDFNLAQKDALRGVYDMYVVVFYDFFLRRKRVKNQSESLMKLFIGGLKSLISGTMCLGGAYA